MIYRCNLHTYWSVRSQKMCL